MPTIRSIDMMLLSDLFEMGSGYVLDFSNPAFSQFFNEELNVNIDDPLYAREGGSKGKRLRYFLQTADKPTVIRALNALWEYREATRLRSKTPETIENALERFLAVVAKLEGRSQPASATRASPAPTIDKGKIAKLKGELLGLHGMEPHARGYPRRRGLRRQSRPGWSRRSCRPLPRLEQRSG